MPSYGYGSYASPMPMPLPPTAPGGGGMSEFEKWQLGLGIAGGLFGAYGQYQQSQADAKTNAARLEEQKREFNTSGAVPIARQLDAAPLRDRAMYLMSHRLGMNPTPFQGATLSQPGSAGGIDPSQMAAANEAYRPGMGGTGGSTQIEQKILTGMGYPYDNSSQRPPELEAARKRALAHVQQVMGAYQR